MEGVSHLWAVAFRTDPGIPPDLIHLTSNDGTIWERLPFPETAADLVAITAQDAARATVTAGDGRTYVTYDAGRTWSLQEDPAAPF